MSMPSGPKHVMAGAHESLNHGHGEFNQAPGDATGKITEHFTGAGRFPGGGAAGGATRTPGDEGHAVRMYQNDHDWDDAPIAPNMRGRSDGC